MEGPVYEPRPFYFFSNHKTSCIYNYEDPWKKKLFIQPHKWLKIHASRTAWKGLRWSTSGIEWFLQHDPKLGMYLLAFV